MEGRWKVSERQWKAPGWRQRAVFGTAADGESTTTTRAEDTHTEPDGSVRCYWNWQLHPGRKTRTCESCSAAVTRLVTISNRSFTIDSAASRAAACGHMPADSQPSRFLFLDLPLLSTAFPTPFHCLSTAFLLPR